MTFKHKLSVRLALLKDVLPLVPVVALLAACEVPTPVAPINTSINVSTVVVIPPSVTLNPGQLQQFASYGRTPTGDSVAINVTWRAVGGGGMSANGLYTAGTTQGDYAVIATLVPPAAIGAPPTAVPMTTSVVHVDPLAQIVVVPASTTVVTGGTQQFAAYGRRSMGDSVDLSVTWGATGGTISASGLYTAGATPGGYVVSASADGLTATATVTALSTPVDTVIVTPDSVNLALGSTQQLTAIVKDASGNVLTGRTVTWETSSSAIATVSSSGLVTGVTPGTATITATSEGKKGRKNAKVANLPVASVTVSPNPATVYLGASVQLAASLKDANGSPLSGRTVVWTTSNGTVASVDSTGLVTGIAVGTATITATSEGQTGTATLTVSIVPVASVVVAPSAANILVGGTVQLTATARDSTGAVLAGRAITWSSSNQSVATASSNGLATGVAAGTATITATSEGKNASAAVSVANVPVASVVISPATALVLVGASVQLVASPKDAAGNMLSGRAITWASSAPATATVSSAGVVTGVAAGAVTITATSEGMTGSAAVTVNLVPVASVSISPTPASVAVGQTTQLTATLRDATGNLLSGRAVAWTTSNAAVATVTASGQLNVGVVAGVGAGSATITATSEGKSATSTVTTTLVPVASVTVSPASATITVGGTQQLSAVTRDAAGNLLSGRVVTWVSGNTSIATVSGSGLVTGQAAGSATITATSEGKSGTAAMTIQAAGPPSHAGWYVTPSGSASGSGSSSSPWDLATALSGAGGRVQPGDTIWLRGGTYVGSFSATLNGTATARVVVRQYPGERATLDGTLNVYGSYSVFWGFEIMRSAPTGSLAGIDYRGLASQFINLVVHDAANSGIGFWGTSVGGELYGCLVYNNGTHYNQDHGIYFNSTYATDPTKSLTDNIVFNNWAYGLHGWGPNPGEHANLHLDGNVSFGNASISYPVNTAADILVGGSPATGLQITNSYTYERAGAGTWAARIGVSTPSNQDAVITGNTFVGFVQVGPWSTATMNGNVFYSSANVLSIAAPTGLSWSRNAHYRDPATAAWGTTDVGSFTTFAGWKATTGLGGSDSIPGMVPTGTQVIIRPNKYEPGRANIIVYNWSGAATVSVDLSNVLTSGQSYDIVNAQDFYGTPVVSGRYSGGAVSLPMAGITPPAPLGRTFTPAPVTGPWFNVFVVRPSGS
jgi:uncharacterized protein YjdB